MKLKFAAPKTVVMGIIINGLLNRDLNWTMILIGAMIAVTLELCGVSSLAFAVGVYVPMQYSTAIFLGGMARWGVDAFSSQMAAAGGSAAERAEAEVRAIAKSESSPGVLLASGFIAGGSLAGVLLAFFEFSPDLKEGIDYASKVKGTPLDTSGAALGLFVVLIALLFFAGAGLLFRPGGDDTEGPRAGEPGGP